MIIKNINEAIKIAKTEVKDPYALAYLEKIPEAIEEFGSHGFEVQMMYALNNMSSWRGENARNAKIVIKDFLKSKRMM